VASKGSSPRSGSRLPLLQTHSVRLGLLGGLQLESLHLRLRHLTLLVLLAPLRRSTLLLLLTPPILGALSFGADAIYKSLQRFGTT
jgi:hypothetical protein